jgi:hypothetical protein
MHTYSDGCYGGDQTRICVSKDEPKTNPSEAKAKIHGVANVTVKADDN